MPSRLRILKLLLLCLSCALPACGSDEAPRNPASAASDEGPATLAVSGVEPLALPPLADVDLSDGERLGVVATTSIIGDLVGEVGDGFIELTTLMPPGQDPHSYQPAAGDLGAVSQADLIFVNGWRLEEGLLDDLETIGAGAVIVPVSAGIQPLPLGDAGVDDAHAVDAHTWLDPVLVRQWLRNIEESLSALDPANQSQYVSATDDYLAELDDLIVYMDEQMSTVEPDRRRLVTNHDSLGYLAQRYHLELLGTVIPAASTLAEPSAGALTDLITAMEAAGVCTIFAESTAGSDVAETVAGELATCDEVQVLSLYTGALGPPGSGAESYLSMMRTNTQILLSGLAAPSGDALR